MIGGIYGIRRQDDSRDRRPAGHIQQPQHGQEALEHLASKSDEELEREILRIKSQLRANNVTYDKQLEMLKNIAPMMDARQRARLRRVIELLSR